MAELRTHFHLFAYGTLRRGGKSVGVLSGCEHVALGAVGGVLYDINGEHPALVLYGNAPIKGDIWRCPNDLLAALDEFEGVAKGLFRRVGVNVRSVGSNAVVACWTYVAGPALSQKLLPNRRVAHWPV